MNFKKWFLNEEYESLDANIPMPEEIRVLSDLFSKHGAKLYVVGGAVRDYLYNFFHKNNAPYKPKDVDLATDKSPEQIIKILTSSDAVSLGIKVFEKGISFGVVSAILNGEEFEIATFRKEYYDSVSGDGRRPDEVTYSNAKEDAKRRDLNINALYYDLQNNQIKDYNIDSSGKGQGLFDIKNKKVRVVDDPFDRFREDKLRVLRLVRFFSRFNDDIIISHLDARTLKAVDEFKDLNGVSKERISAEFLSGIKTCQNVENYILSFKSLKLLDVMFPSLEIETSSAVNNTKNPIAIMSYMFKSNEPSYLRKTLNELKYSNEISNTVSYILNIFYQLDETNILKLLRMKENLNEYKKTSILEYGKIIKEFDKANYFLNYEIKTNSKDYNHLKGAEISKKINQDEYMHYTSQLSPS
jgi:tRNA nucleotidyltransferase/poly(A) polymerase